jgi:F0F1-type ATP synthase delta subunit
VAENQKHPLVLTVSVVGRVDLGRLVREVGALENYLEQEAIRKPEETAILPRLTRQLTHVAQINKLDLLKNDDVARLKKFLEDAKEHAPVMHMSFSAEPSPRFLDHLITWLRREIHPMVLVQVGLQPTIGAGCLVRTKNKYFDFSLRQRFTNERHKLLSLLQNSSQASETEAKEEKVKT